MDLELFGLELERDLRLEQHELLLKRSLLDEARAECQTATIELQAAKASADKERGEKEELKAQLNVRFLATQRLEEENSSLRENLAMLRVQTDAYAIERQSLLGRCQESERELSIAKQQLTDLQGKLDCYEAFKTNYTSLHAKTRDTISQIMSNQALLEKEHSKLEKAFQECMNFGRIVQQHADLQSKFVSRSNRNREETEKKLLALSALLEEVKLSKNESIDDNTMEPIKSNYLQEWEEYRKEMEIRIKGFINQNKALREEIECLRSKDSAVYCEKCLNEVETIKAEII